MFNMTNRVKELEAKFAENQIREKQMKVKIEEVDLRTHGVDNTIVDDSAVIQKDLVKITGKIQVDMMNHLDARFKQLFDNAMEARAAQTFEEDNEAYRNLTQRILNTEHAIGRRVFKIEEKILGQTGPTRMKTFKEDGTEDLSLDVNQAPEEDAYKHDKISQMAIKMEAVEQDIDYHREQISQHADVI